eukprot:82831-Chlamydomonas_euryale.AAC.3
MQSRGWTLFLLPHPTVRRLTQRPSVPPGRSHCWSLFCPLPSHTNLNPQSCASLNDRPCYLDVPTAGHWFAPSLPTPTSTCSQAPHSMTTCANWASRRQWWLRPCPGATPAPARVPASRIFPDACCVQKCP